MSVVPASSHPIPLSTLPPFVDRVVEAYGARWSITALSDGALAVDELVDTSPKRGGCFTPGFYEYRATSDEDIVRMAIDHSALDSDVIREVSIELVRGATLAVEKDGELPIAISVGVYAASDKDQIRYACVQNRRGLPLVGSEEWDVSDPRNPLIYSRTCTSEDWSAFGAARTFVCFVGRVRAREALRKARAVCCMA